MHILTVKLPRNYDSFTAESPQNHDNLPRNYRGIEQFQFRRTVESAGRKIPVDPCPCYLPLPPTGPLNRMLTVYLL